jgi:hypothetical protein
MKTVRAGREKLQVSPIPPVEIGEQGDTSLAASGSSLRPSGNPGALAAPDGAGPGIGAVEDPEGFFDQDLD